MFIKIGVSNRHIHLTKEDFETLCGKNATLEKRNDLVQPGEYASTTTVTIKTDKDKIENVRVLGPLRNYTQVEISKTDAYKLGLNPPVRNSGELDGSSPITIVGPLGEVNITEGCIIASRHIHLNSEERKKYGLENLTEVKIRITGDKGGILDHVWLKEDDNYVWELHLDSDDGNANMVKTGDIAQIIVENE